MNTGQIWQIESISLKSTLAIASALGAKLRGGEVIELTGDLGSGKTTFVKGLAKGMGCEDQVHSPSFTLSNQYKAAELDLYHFDFYRLKQPGILSNELAEIIDDPRAVIVIEWADVVETLLPDDHLTIDIINSGMHNRLLKFEYPDSLGYLIPSNT